MRRLAILGAGGHGRVVADAAQCAGWDAIDLFDDAAADLPRIGPWQIIGPADALDSRLADYDGVVVGIGDNRKRVARLRELATAGARLAAIVHPAATVSAFASIGPGAVVFAGAVVNIGASIGLGCIVNTSASIDHDCMLADGVHVSPGAHLGGGVRVGEAAWIGIGAAVKHGMIIGARAIVGAGAAVVKDVPDDVTVVGTPARILTC